jgi:P4 family phage/plasmid primase-like protien
MEESTSSNNSIVPSESSYADFYDFLAKHSVYKTNDSSKKTITNTRIGDTKKNIHGGSYNVSDAEYPTFLKLYYRDIVAKNKKEYFTEKQRDNDGPIAVDLDFRYQYDIDEKQYTREHVEDLIFAYLEELKKMFQFDDSSKFHIYLFEKPSVNRIQEKQLTKDGIHMIIGIQMDRIGQQILRQRMISKVRDMWRDLPITNKWEDVFDEGISKGSVNWQLYGSRKPGMEKYGLTGIFDIKYDNTDGEFSFNEIPQSRFSLETNFSKLSVRNKDNLSLFMKNDFISEYEKFKKDNNMTNERIIIPTNNSVAQQHRLDMMLDNVVTIARIKNPEELDLAVNTFLDSVTDNTSDYNLKTMYEYTMALPEKYYGEGSYDKWIRVGWVLRNTSNKLLIVWIAFSAKSSTFQYSSIPDLCDEWQKFDLRLQDGLTKLSLIHWVKSDAREEYDKIRMSTVDYYINLTLSNTNPKYKAPDFDIATVLYQMHKHEYVCVSNKSNIWYRYSDNRWRENDSGVDLRRAISGRVRDMYTNKSFTMMESISNKKTIINENAPVTRNEEETGESETDKTRSLQLLAIIPRLGSTTDKIKIMTEAKELFYDGSFLQRMDTNPYLLCFNNGVIDFKEKVFRKGNPEDYISLCTNIDYIKLTSKHQPIIDEINEFMKQLFPEPPLCKYMWEHLASTLIGTSANQTFNMYYGFGQNGKSVLVSLMEKILGDYKGDVPLSLITDKRGKVGGLAPEIVQLKGKRYAVMQEPSKNDTINEGIMKQITSGKDPLQGRAPYMPQTISFIPQCKLVVTCNTLMNVNSDDHGTWRRIRAVPFKALFTENPVEGDKEKPYQFKLDKYIDEKFDKWKEVFASMLVDIVFKTNGVVNDCDIVMAKSNEYRQSQDYISEFIRDKIVKDAEGRIKKMELNNEFSIWYASNYGGRGPSPKDLHEYMHKEFGRARNQVWSGVRIRYENDDDDDDDMGEAEYNDDINSDDL